jgi:hypothetical protein
MIFFLWQALPGSLLTPFYAPQGYSSSLIARAGSPRCLDPCCLKTLFFFFLIARAGSPGALTPVVCRRLFENWSSAHARARARAHTHTHTHIQTHTQTHTQTQVSSNVYELQAGCDVVAFDNLPHDNHGLVLYYTHTHTHTGVRCGSLGLFAT